MLFHCLLVPLRQVLCDWSVFEHRRSSVLVVFSLSCVVVVVVVYPLRCYCSVRCSLVSPCLDGWLGDGAWEGCVPEGRLWAMGTPPGTRPSSAPGSPPGATPTMPGGYLVQRKVAESQRSGHTLAGDTGSFLLQEPFLKFLFAADLKGNGALRDMLGP